MNSRANFFCLPADERLWVTALLLARGIPAPAGHLVLESLPKSVTSRPSGVETSRRRRHLSYNFSCFLIYQASCHVAHLLPQWNDWKRASWYGCPVHSLSCLLLSALCSAAQVSSRHLCNESERASI
ncbi:uncharacterized protein [Dermacentor albipictus]|uniref:uncharacterized protein n=1 Tax=Dermacentor albipictus TaxID=60249 RepID=UPI0038FBFCB6